MHTNYKGDDVQVRTGNARALKKYPFLANCAMCSAPAVDRHHIDGNPLNNDDSNLMFLCRTHHMEIDGRMDKVIEMQKSKVSLKIKKPCQVCGQLSFPLRKGKCHACNEYYRRNGKDRNARLKDGKLYRSCKECGEWFELDRLNRRYCTSCKRIRLLYQHAEAEKRRRERMRRPDEKVV